MNESTRKYEWVAAYILSSMGTRLKLESFEEEELLSAHTSYTLYFRCEEGYVCTGYDLEKTDRKKDIENMLKGMLYEQVYFDKNVKLKKV